MCKNMIKTGILNLTYMDIDVFGDTLKELRPENAKHFYKSEGFCKMRSISVYLFLSVFILYV